MAEFSKMRLSELKNGDVYLVGSPARLVKVGRKTRHDVPTPNGVMEAEAVEVEGTIAIVPIAGHLDEIMARQAKAAASQES